MDTRQFFLDRILQTNSVYVTFLDGSIDKLELPTIQVIQEKESLEFTLWGMIDKETDSPVTGLLFVDGDIETTIHGLEVIIDVDGSIICKAESGKARLLCDIEGPVHKTIGLYL